MASLEAHALALGRLTVQSALGEPLRAEIEISDIKPDEAASLRAGVAPAEAFRVAGMEYGTVVSGVEVTLQRRADGQAFLRLRSNRPVTEPFVDLILEANWSNGRITRDYTMLFDPPALRSGSGSTATAPILSRPASPNVAPPAKGIASIPYSPAGPSASATRPAPAARPLEKAPAGETQVTVKSGDTAGKIAAQNKPASVSLDQMLVALLRSNPDAFIGGNVNRIKSGAVLDIPSAESASAISSSEATQTIIAQSKDFNTFRRKLAEGVPATQVASADRQAGGKVEAKVEDRAAASATPDKLTLSKGAVQGKAATAAEEKIAKDRQAKEASTRVAELSKNISDLNKLGSSPATAPAASAAKTPGVAVPAPSSTTLPVPAAPATAASSAPASTTSTTAAVTAAPAASAAVAGTTPAAAMAPASAASATAASADPLAAASQPASTASEPAAPVAAAPAAPKKPVVLPPPPPEPSLIDELMENPLVLPGIGLLVALLAGFGFYRYRQRGSAGQVDSSFLESRLQPDSFFGASGGQRIDTNEGNATGSSLVYSPSQLDAAGDVDPVAEADVYLAYGRDLQAEEILKEAMRTSPMRVAIHAKLMEIYAKRRDSKAFETVAIEAFNLTHGSGPEWAYITEMGRELDPSNPMYQPGGQPAGAASAAGTSAFSPGGTVAMVAQPVNVPAPTPAVDVDLDLDFSLGDEPDATAPAAISAPVAPKPVAPPPVAKTPEPASAMNMDFSSATIAMPTATPPAPAAAKPVEAAPEISFLSEGLNFEPEPFVPPAKPVPPVKAAAAPAPAPAVADSGMLEFDLGSLSLDLNGPVTESPAPAIEASSSDDPLETKFMLAEEFRSLGDTDGARSLAEEVLAEASGPLKVKAQAFLNALS
ncbi:FimV/HubP family polar landmark protein [Polaromonas aquatica]|uniref:FimV/HubP family polar landmark protein n=1 Tax=Polaromonas aquatica TaxID=332657 RepID=UPI003D65B9D7